MRDFAAQPPSEAELDAILEHAAQRERTVLRVGLVGGWICLVWMIALAIVVDAVFFAVAFGIVLAAITRVGWGGLRTLDTRIEARRQELQALLAERRGPGAQPSGT